MHIKAIMSIAILWSVFATLQSVYAMEDRKNMFSEKGHNNFSRVRVLESASIEQKSGILGQQYIIDNDLLIAKELYNDGNILAALQYVSNSCVVVKFFFGMFLFTQKYFAQAQILFQNVADTHLSEEEMKDVLTRKSVTWAQFNLAHMLEVTIDEDGNSPKTEALKYYRLAASNGSLEAHFKAAVLLCEAENYQEARLYLAILARNNNKNAWELLRFVESKLRTPQTQG